MDKCTREVRKQSWKNIITQCMPRPEGMTAKQWLDANGISEQSYYCWLTFFTRNIFNYNDTIFVINNMSCSTLFNCIAFAKFTHIFTPI